MRTRHDSEALDISLPALRFEIPEAARILRMSRAQLYIRIQQGALRAQKDGGRTYITRSELERYVEACDAGPAASIRRLSAGSRPPGILRRKG